MNNIIVTFLLLLAAVVFFLAGRYVGRKEDQKIVEYCEQSYGQKMMKTAEESCTTGLDSFRISGSYPVFTCK